VKSLANSVLRYRIRVVASAIVVVGAIMGWKMASPHLMDLHGSGAIRAVGIHEHTLALGSARDKRSTKKAFLAGVVEGFYGPSWSVRDTLHMFQFMHHHFMNAFVYAPKYDLYERADWRQPYPRASWITMEKLIAGARANDIQFIYSISPGLNITYSSIADRNLLIAKINQLRAGGVHTFMLSLDDITGTLNAEDASLYKHNLAQAQSSLANYVWRTERAVDPQFRLLLAETNYFGTSDNAYWAGLKRYLAPQIDPIWTGSWALANTMTSAQVALVEKEMGHRLIIWDNYPVNDFTYIVAKKPVLFMGPLVGRSAGIPKLVDGYFFNPMYQSRASEIALSTGGDYLHDPAHYNPEDSWNVALHTIGGSAYTALRLFAEDERSRYYDNLQPTALVNAVASYWKHDKVLRSFKTNSLYRQFEAMAAVNSILAKRLPDHALYKEIAPFARLLSLQGSVGMEAIVYDQRKRFGSVSTHQTQQLRRNLQELDGNPDVIAGTVVQTFVATVLSKSNH